MILGTNAVKFTPKGGVVLVRLTVLHCSVFRASPEKHPCACLPECQGVLRIEVNDYGAGIEAEHLRQIFQEVKVFDLAKLSSRGSLGLGLWISSKLASYHDGVVGLRSEGLGAGSTTYVDLPVLKLPNNNMSDGVTCQALNEMNDPEHVGRKCNSSHMERFSSSNSGDLRILTEKIGLLSPVSEDGTLTPLQYLELRRVAHHGHESQYEFRPTVSEDEVVTVNDSGSNMG